MQKYKLLSIDESGKASFSHASDMFILSGIIIPEKLKPKINQRMQILKIKFFKDENLIFHARDMVRKKGPFSILNDEKVNIDFWSEFISIVNNSEISFIIIMTNKMNAKKANWQLQTILKRSYIKILENFTKHLIKTKYSGKILTESDPDQDTYLIYAHNRLQAIEKGYKSMVTSLSLVNKFNQDIDVQLADAMALIARSKFDKNYKHTKIEKMKIKLLNRKLVDKNNPSVLEALI